MPELEPDPGDLLFKPWDLRERLKPLRTYSGRVVYERRKHFFSLKRVARIIELYHTDDPAEKSLWEKLWDGLINIFFTTWNFDKSWVYAVGNTIKQLVYQNWDLVGSPWDTVRQQYKELIFALIAEFQLADDVRDHFGWKESDTDGYWS